MTKAEVAGEIAEVLARAEAIEKIEGAVTEIVAAAKWIDVKRGKKRRTEGTHSGVLTPEARKTRAAKNARNKSRRGMATRPRGSQSKSRSDGSRRTGR